jgi:predicted TIM-barrel fold metal-dependent hydrolase
LGTAGPKSGTPARACDSHIHIYDGRFPVSGPTARLVQGARVAEYRRLQGRLGTTRTVIVTPAPYRFDNAVTLDAIARLGIENARGVAVINLDITDAELSRLHASGIRGIRFTLFDPNTAVTRFEWVAPLAARIAELGWHVQMHLRGDQIAARAEVWRTIPGTLVFDHMARIPASEGVAHPAFKIITRLMENGRTWVKLSGAYLDGEEPDFADRAPIARGFITQAPERVIWGSDWPHPTEAYKPDDARLFDLLSDWTRDERQRHRILVENPARLYGFAS